MGSRCFSGCVSFLFFFPFFSCKVKKKYSICAVTTMLKKKIIEFWRLKSTVKLPQHRKINLLNRMRWGAESHVWWNVPFMGRCEYDTRFRVKRVSHDKVWLKFSLHVWVWNVKVKRLLRLFEDGMWTCAHTWCLDSIYSNFVSYCRIQESKTLSGVWILICSPFLN